MLLTAILYGVGLGVLFYLSLSLNYNTHLGSYLAGMMMAYYSVSLFWSLNQTRKEEQKEAKMVE